MTAAVRANKLNGSDWLKNSFSVWRGLGRDAVPNHPAPFPVALVTKIIDCFAADRKGTLLDPFAGSGSALLAALRCGMNAVGVDINPAYRNVFMDRLSILEHSAAWTYLIGDARSLNCHVRRNSAEICVTSPPYWNILSRRRTADGKNAHPYSDSADDLGNLDDYAHFLGELSVVAKEIAQTLHVRSYFVLNVMDIRKGPRFYPLHQDASSAVLETKRFTLEDIIIWDRQADYNAMRPLGYPYKFVINKVHEYLLVFRKDDTHD